jgi:hypothetical protein
MTTSPSATSAAARARRPRNTAPLTPQTSKEAKRLATVILEVLAGLRTPGQAAEALQTSLPRYYQLETRAVQGLAAACEPRPQGRRPEPTAALTALQQENARLQREASRQQALVRLAQRAVGVAAPAAPSPKASGKRKRRAKARALTAAARLRREAADADRPGGDGTSAGSS